MFHLKQFDDMVRLLHKNPGKQEQIRMNLEQLRRRNVDIPLSAPGGG